MQPCGCMSTGTSNQSSADESNPRGSVARTEVKPRLTYSRVVLSSCCSRAQAERSPRVARATADGQIALRGSRSRWLTHPSLLAMVSFGFRPVGSMHGQAPRSGLRPGSRGAAEHREDTRW